VYAAYSSIFVLFAQDILGLGAVGYGILLTSGALGGLIGSLAADRTLLGSVLLSAAALGGTAVTGNAFAVGGLFVLVGICVVIWNVITVSLRQAVIPENLFGRVNSVYRLLGWGAIPIGALLGGFLARGLGLTAPMWFGAAVLVALALATFPLVNNRTVDEAHAGHPSA
jgi:hypothetical protein